MKVNKINQTSKLVEKRYYLHIISGLPHKGVVNFLCTYFLALCIINMV